MSKRNPPTLKQPMSKRFKFDNDTKVNYSDLENLPNGILLKIFKNINPKIKKLIELSHVCSKMRLIAHDP